MKIFRIFLIIVPFVFKTQTLPADYKKLYARMTNYNWDTTSGIEIADEKDAVQKALASHAIMFSTYEVTSVTIGGKEMKGEPENFSPRRYIGIDRVYTRDEVVQSRGGEQARGRDGAGGRGGGGRGAGGGRGGLGVGQ